MGEERLWGPTRDRAVEGGRVKLVHVVVEGPTELGFIDRVLGPYFVARGVWLFPHKVETARRPRGEKMTGGGSNWKKIRDDVGRYLRDTSAAAVTTVFDYYALPKETPGMASRPEIANPSLKVEHVERAIAADLDHPKFIPHITLFELEAYVYVQPEAVRPFVEPPDDPASIADQLLGIRETCGGAERINDKRETSPSHRLHRVWPAYDKALHGPAVIESIGLPALRGACPHFDAWIIRLENL